MHLRLGVIGIAPACLRFPSGQRPGQGEWQQEGGNPNRSQVMWRLPRACASCFFQGCQAVKLRE
jgi:hypothetical protein